LSRRRVARAPVGWATDDDDLFSPDMREARSTEPHAQLALRLGAVRIAFSYTDFQLSLRIASRYATTIASVMGVLGSPDVPQTRRRRLRRPPLRLSPRASPPTGAGTILCSSTIASRPSEATRHGLRIARQATMQR
jgi:hypothetical protein